MMNLGMEYIFEHLLFITDLDPKHLHYVLYKMDGDDASVYIYTIYPESIRNGSAIYGAYHMISYVNGTAYNNGSAPIDNMIAARTGWSNLVKVGYQRLPNETEVMEKVFEECLHESDKVVEWVMV